jgi:hypothetical protein
MRAAGVDRFGAAVRPMTLPDPRALALDEVLIRVIAAVPAGGRRLGHAAGRKAWTISRRARSAACEAAFVVRPMI